MYRTLTIFVLMWVLVFMHTGCNGSGNDRMTGNTDYRVDEILTGLEHPWGIAFLPGDDNLALLTERPGRMSLVYIDQRTKTGISGIPEVAATGQGGLLDVAVHPEFEENRLVYMSYAAEGDAPGQYATHVARGRIDFETNRLLDVEVVLIATPFSDTSAHFGSRLVFDAENRLYVTSGDRRNRHSAQDLERLHGKTLRIMDDGSIPPENPFVDEEDAHPAIYSYGHRNSQGMTRHPETGEIWQNEHGEYGGDEINILERGANFGWPVATYAREYSDQSDIGVLPPEHEASVNPVYYWGESDGFPPSGMTFYQGAAFEEWEGDLFIGGLREQYLVRFEVDGQDLEKAEHLLENRGWRIRDVGVNPSDGFIYVLVDDPDAPLVQISPEPGE
ncbi:MAG: PQQ-dependent sugar dehydrogenase [Desulfovibrionales bacterium]